MATKKGGQQAPVKQLQEQVLELERTLLHTSGAANEKTLSSEECFERAQELLMQSRQDKLPAATGRAMLSEGCYYLYLAHARGDRRAMPYLQEICIRHSLSMHQDNGHNADAMLKRLIKGQRLTLEQAIELNAAYSQYLMVFSARVLHSVPGVPPHLVPDQVLGVLRYILESREVSAQATVESVGLAECISQYLEQLHPSSGEMLVNESLADFFSWSLTRGEMVRSFFGLPSEAACRIGLAYLEGRELKKDRILAARLLMYAALTGSPRAMIAWNVAYEAFDFIQEVREDTASFERYTANLMHALLLAVLGRKMKDESDCPDIELGSGGKCGLEAELFLSAVALIMLRQDYAGMHAPAEELQIYGTYLEDAVQEYGINTTVYQICASRYLNCLGQEITPELMQKWRKLYRIDSLVTDPMVPYALLKRGLTEQNEDARFTLLMLRVFDHSDRLVREGLEALFEQGYAKAGFMLGTYYWSRDNAMQSKKQWLRGAAMGSPMSQFNTALSFIDQRNYARAERYAVRAARNGIPQAFYLLYQLARLKKTPQSKMDKAYTCLRYAADFMMKDAVAELSRVREEGKYRPLPFMRAVEKLEYEAQSDPTAAVFMGSLYSYGVIMPRDRFMSLYWFRHAAALGDLQSAQFLSGIYASLWEYEDNGFVTSSAKHALDVLSRYGIGCVKEPAGKQSRTPSLVRRLFHDLRHGKSVFEQQIFREAELSPLWSIFNAREMKGDTPIMYYEVESQFYTTWRGYIDQILNCSMFDYDTDNSVDEHSWRLDLAKIMDCDVLDEDGCEIYLKHLAAVRALTALRGLDVLDPQVLERECLSGFNADSLICTALLYTKRDSLFAGHAQADVAGTDSSGGYFDMTLAQ